MDFGSSQFLIQTHQVTLPARGRKPSDREQWASTSKATRANPLGCLFRRSGPGMIVTFLRSRFLSLPSPHQNPNVEPHGLTAVAPLDTLRRAEPSEAYPPCLLRRSSRFGCEGRAPRLRRVPTSHSSTGFHPWLR